MKPKTSRRPRSVRCAGLTLLEVMGATIVLSMAVVSSSYVMSQATTTRASMHAGPIDAALLAAHIHEAALGLSREPSGLGIATSGSDVLALDTLDGAVFSPPIDAQLEVIPASTGWAQHVDLRIVDPADPENSRALTTADSMGEEVIELVVTISEFGRSKGEFTWWLTP